MPWLDVPEARTSSYVLLLTFAVVALLALILGLMALLLYLLRTGGLGAFLAEP